MNKRIRKIAEDCVYEHNHPSTLEEVNNEYFDLERFAELIVEECAKELREAEQEADRAYKATEVKERMVFDGYDFAEMLEERFGVDE